MDITSLLLLHHFSVFGIPHIHIHCIQPFSIVHHTFCTQHPLQIIHHIVLIALVHAILVTVQMDPYPFPPHLTLCATLRQASWMERHDLTLDHANGQSISLSITLP